MNKRHCIIRILVTISTNLLACQFTLSQVNILGKVFEDSIFKHPVEKATCILSLQGKIVFSSKSDSLGNFKIIIDDASNQTIFKLSVIHPSFLFYEKSFKLTDSLKIDVQHLNVYLKRKPILLDTVEIVAFSKKPFIKGDTIVYSVQGFKDVSDRTIGDVIKKIPGVEVFEDGTVKYNGKELSLITLDGERLTSNSYKIFTNNLSAHTIKDVEIIQNFHENRLMKSLIGTSDNISINLKLDSSKSTKLNGSISLGGFLFTRYLADGNIFQLGKKIKTLALWKANNVGEPNSGNKIAKTHPPDLFEKFFETNTFQSGSFAKDYTIGAPPVAIPYWYSNNDGMVHLSTSTIINPHITLRVGGEYSKENLTIANSLEELVYPSSGERWIFLQKNQKHVFNTDGILNMDIEHDGKKNNVGLIKIKFLSGNYESNYQSMTNGIIKDSLTSLYIAKPMALSLHAIENFKISEKSLFRILLNIYRNNLIEDESLTTGRISEFLNLPDSNIANSNQRDIKNFALVTTIQYFLRKKRIFHKIEGQVNLRNSIAYSGLSVGTSFEPDALKPLNSFINQDTIDRNISYLSYSYTSSINKFWEHNGYGKIGIQQHNSWPSKEVRANNYYYQAGISISYRKNLFNAITFGIRSENNYPDIFHYFPYNYLAPGPSFRFSLLNCKPIQNYGINLNYHSISLAKGFTFLLNASYSFSPAAIGDSAIFVPTANENHTILFDSPEYLMNIFGKIEKNIPFAKSRAIIEMLYNNRNEPLVSNGYSGNNRFDFLKTEFTLVSRFGKIFSTSNSIVLTYSNNILATNAYFKSKNSTLGFSTMIKGTLKQFSISGKYSYHRFTKNTRIDFLDLFTRIKLKKYITVEGSIRNALNVKSLSYKMLYPTSTSLQLTRLNSRIAYVSFFCNF
jgi:hypothetical protein